MTLVSITKNQVELNFVIQYVDDMLLTSYDFKEI